MTESSLNLAANARGYFSNNPNYGFHATRFVRTRNALGRYALRLAEKLLSQSFQPRPLRLAIDFDALRKNCRLDCDLKRCGKAADGGESGRPRQVDIKRRLVAWTV